MGNVLTDGNGHVIVASNNAFEVTSAIDSNIQAGNIKKDVTILGVTGTYEGSGGGGSVTSVTPNAEPSTIYYVDSAGTINTYDPMPYGGTISCLSGSMLVIVYDINGTSELSNCTIIDTYASGRGASFNRIVIYQVD